MQPAPHILFLSYDGMTDPLGQSQVIPYLQGLSRAGYSISLISFEKEAPFKLLRSTIQELLDQSAIQWIPLIYTKSPPILSTLYDMVRMYKTAKNLHSRHPIKVLHARSYISALIANSLAQRVEIPWVFDMRGFYADERVDGNLWPQSNSIFRLIYRYFKKKEIIFLEDSTAVISLTDAGKRIIERDILPGISPNKVQVIPCCADLDRFNYEYFTPEDRARVRAELGIGSNSLVVVYSGSVGTWYMLPKMLKWFSLLLSNKPGAVFLFLSAERELIEREAKKLAIPEENLRIQKVPYAKVPVMLTAADVGLFFIVPTFSKQASSPTKMGEIMGMGIPIVCNSGVGDVGAIVLDSGCGLAIDVDREEELIYSVREVGKLLSLDRAFIRQAAFRHYSLSLGVERYKSVYRAVLNQEFSSGNS